MTKTDFKRFIDEDELNQTHIVETMEEFPRPPPKNPWWKHWLSGLLLCALLLIISALVLCIWALSSIVQNAHHHKPTPPPTLNLLKIVKRSMLGGEEPYKRTYPLLLHGNTCLPQSNTTAFFLHRPSNKEPLLDTLKEVHSRRRDLKSSVEIEQVKDIKEAIKFNAMFRQLLTVYWLENQESSMTTCIWGPELKTVYTVSRNHKAREFILTPSSAPEEGILCYSLLKIQLNIHWYCTKGGIEFSAKYDCGTKNEGTTEITYRNDDLNYWCMQLGTPSEDPNASRRM